MAYLIHQRKLLLWKKICSSDNVVLRSLSHFTWDAFIVIGSTYDVHSSNVSNNAIKGSIWISFAALVNKYIVSLLPPF